VRTLLAVTVFYCCICSIAKASDVVGWGYYSNTTDTVPRKEVQPNMLPKTVHSKYHDVFYFAVPAAEISDEKVSVQKIVVSSEVKRPQLLKVTGN
jgi:hypothetical protein